MNARPRLASAPRDRWPVPSPCPSCRSPASPEPRHPAWAPVHPTCPARARAGPAAVGSRAIAITSSHAHGNTARRASADPKGVVAGRHEWPPSLAGPAQCAGIRIRSDRTGLPGLSHRPPLWVCLTAPVLVNSGDWQGPAFGFLPAIGSGTATRRLVERLSRQELQDCCAVPHRIILEHEVPGVADDLDA